MALITHDYFSPSIGMATEIQAVLPEKVLTGGTEPVETLILLCAHGESSRAWLKNARLELLCEEAGICAVLVPCLQGDYTDMAYGYPFAAFLREIPAVLERELPGVRLLPGTVAVAGIGEGGRAALSWYLETPDLFTAAGVFEGAERSRTKEEQERQDLLLYGGSESKGEAVRRLKENCEKRENSRVLFVSEDSGKTLRDVLSIGEQSVLSGLSASAFPEAALRAFLTYWKGGNGK